jgi:DNA-binding NarL/FixJ family response regulator
VARHGGVENGEGIGAERLRLQIAGRITSYRSSSGSTPRSWMNNSKLSPALPLVGRADELQLLRGGLAALAQGVGGVWLVTGEAGAGKTRLAGVLLEEAERRGLGTAAGRAYPVEAGVPYGLFADALQPLVRRLAPDALARLTRGGGDLGEIFPGMIAGARGPHDAQQADFRSRLHWQFTHFLHALAAKKPLVLVLEDLHWADASSLELLHLVSRQVLETPLLLYCSYNPDQDRPAALEALERSLTARGAATIWPLQPLPESAVAELVQRGFDVGPEAVGAFVSHLHGWTRGNPFFVEETLKALIASGDLRQEDGRWTGWATETLTLPGTVRDAVLARLGSLSAEARRVAETAAVLGARMRFETLATLSTLPEDGLLAAIEELRRGRVLQETTDGADILLDFAQPLLREVLYGELGRLRRRALHSSIAKALEELYGAGAAAHADELAYHFARAQSTESAKAATYQRLAGRRALQKYANREAADYLSGALQRMRGVAEPDELVETMADLARAYQRLGDYPGALRLWLQVQQHALQRGDLARAAAAARSMGLACNWTGRHADALAHYDEGMAWALEAGDARLQVLLGIARASCLHELARLDEALAAAEAALLAAEAPSSPELSGRVHRTLMQIHLWRGDAASARAHGQRALELSALSGDLLLAFMAHWAMGVLEGFSGSSAGIEYHVAESSRLADELHSPVLRAWVAELKLEYASARGEWDSALVIGEDAIRTARELNQHTLLPRLLVWTGLIHLGRSDFERGEAYVEEAWRLAGAGTEQPRNIHAVLPAYIGRAGARLARGDYEGAIRIGEEGLGIADRAGYSLWAVHRLLPIIAESYLWLRQLDGARRAGERLRRDSERLGYQLGTAWASACDALVAWLGGDNQRGAVLLRSAAEQLEALPFMPDATRLRRQLAGRLADLGDRDGALRELRTVHERLTSLRAGAELQKARAQFRELGVRPPPRGTHRPPGLLTQRELAVADSIASQKSSKAVARELRISVRTVDAHLANIYRKLSINSRAELAELHRNGRLGADLP